jgi:hypothetical protein
MVFHGFAPTDALEEKVRFTDDQINVFSKAFLGLTVSCARCHDHKFDPISQKDYYALFAILASCRPGRTAIDTPDAIRRNHDSLVSLKTRLRGAIAEDWLAAVPRIGEKLEALDARGKEASADQRALLGPWRVMQEEVANGKDFGAAWRKTLKAYRPQIQQWTAHRSRDYYRQWNLAQTDDYQAWYARGAGLPSRPQSAGEFAVAVTGEAALAGIYPAGAYSHALTAKLPARLTSPDIALDDEYELWVQTIGDPSASLRYVVQDFPRSGTVYPVTQLSPEWRWQRRVVLERGLHPHRAGRRAGCPAVD